MVEISRRGLFGMFAAGAAALIVPAGVLMPIKPIFYACSEALELVDRLTSERHKITSTEGVDLMTHMSAAMSVMRHTDFEFRATPEVHARIAMEMVRNHNVLMGRPIYSGELIASLFRGVPVVTV